jgi:Cu/Zn superoxide dismutase
MTNTKLGLALCMALPIAAAGGQDAERYGERLSRMPVDLRTTSAISGAGSVTADLSGNELTITVRFNGLSSGVTAAHVHNAPVARRGGVAFAVDLGDASGTAGEIVDTVTLTEAQIAELRGARYYVQLHTANNPGGELRGWLLRRDD